MRILFIAYQRILILNHTMTLYFISFFFFLISICFSHFRLIFMDPKLMEIYEQKYTMLTGLYHYLPGKYEVFLICLIFTPIWAIQFLFSTNLNSFCEDQTLEEKMLEENSQTASKFDTVPLNDFDITLTDNQTTSDPKAPSYRKSVVVLKKWNTLTGKQKFMRYFIILAPIIVLWTVNLTIQYSVAFFIKQTNFNFYNVVGNMVAVYLLVFHFSVFMPLMFKRSDCLLEGDYLWNPTCNFIIKYAPNLDMNSLKKAEDEYDQKYLTRLMEGKDPNEEDSEQDIENGQNFWRKSKLADFANQKPNEYGSISDGEDNMNPNRDIRSQSISPFTVKYTTFDANNHEFPDKYSSEHVNASRKNTIKSENSEWTDDAELTPEDEMTPRTTSDPAKPVIKMNDNDFSDEEEEIEKQEQPIFEDPEGENKNQRSSEEFVSDGKGRSSSNEFEKISLERVRTMPHENDKDLDDYFTDIDNKLKIDQMDEKKVKDDDLSIVSDEKEDDYFNVKSEKDDVPNKK